MRPEEYEYCWSNYETNQIIDTGRIFGQFRDADVALMYDPEKKELRFFLALEEHLRIAEDCADVLQNQYELWKDHFQEYTQECERLANETVQHHKDEVPSMSIEKVTDHFFKRVRAFEPFCCWYWYYTNFFSVDKAEALVRSDPNKYQELKRNLDDMGHVKYEARSTLNKYLSFETFQPYVSVLARHYGRNDLEWLSTSQIEDLINGKNVPPSSLGSEKWILAKRFGWKPYRGAEAEAIIKEFNNHFFKLDTGLIRGTVASKGIYKGTARVLRLVFKSEAVRNEAARVTKGDVLIANTTGPEIMDACQRAGAIVTDEGGLTSHAAVVSRELHIPCIVGTKVGSKIIKDGTTVEVNANEGVVKILE